MRTGLEDELVVTIFDDGLPPQMRRLRDRRKCTLRRQFLQDFGLTGGVRLKKAVDSYFLVVSQLTTQRKRDKVRRRDGSRQRAGEHRAERSRAAQRRAETRSNFKRYSLHQGVVFSTRSSYGPVRAEALETEAAYRARHHLGVAFCPSRASTTLKSVRLESARSDESNDTTNVAKEKSVTDLVVVATTKLEVTTAEVLKHQVAQRILLRFETDIVDCTRYDSSNDTSLNFLRFLQGKKTTPKWCSAATELEGTRKCKLCGTISLAFQSDVRYSVRRGDFEDIGLVSSRFFIRRNVDLQVVSTSEEAAPIPSQHHRFRARHAALWKYEIAIDH